MQLIPDDVVVTGHAEIDRDHRNIMAALNELGKAIREDRADRINRSLNDVIDRIIENFEREEALMIMSRYYDYDQHMTQHSQFFAHLTKLIYLHEIGEGLVDSDQQAQLVDWLVNHERDFDRRFVQRLAEIGAVPPATQTPGGDDGGDGQGTG